MSDSSSPSEPSVQISPSNNDTLFSAKLNFSAVLVATTIVFALVKLSALLPQSYYFTLTSLVGGDRASPFIINTPFLLTNDELCERAAAKGIDIVALCWSDDDKDDSKALAASQSQEKSRGSSSPAGQKPADNAPSRGPSTSSSTPSAPAAPKPVDGASAPGTGTSSSTSPAPDGQKPGENGPAFGPTASPPAPSSTVKTEDEQKIKRAQEVLEQIRFEREQRRESARIRTLQSEAPQGKSIIALLLRCLIPIVAGGIVATIYRADLAAEAGIGAALAVVALFWPVAYLWQDLQIGDEWSDKQNLFMILYFCYATLFYFLAKLGSQLGYTYLGARRGQAIVLDYKRMIESFIPGLIAGLFVQLIVFFLLK